MKKYCFILVLNAFLFKANAQYISEEPETDLSIPNWQIGWVASDIAIPAFSLEGSMAYSDRGHWGARLIIPNYLAYWETDLYQETNWAVKIFPFQKLFLPLDHIHALNFTHGPRFGMVSAHYNLETWVERQEFGNTVIAYDEVSGDDQYFTLGYQVQIGFQTRGKFYYALFAGVIYEQVLNQDALNVLDYRNPDEGSLEYFGPGYEVERYVRPTVGIIFGLGSD